MNALFEIARMAKLYREEQQRLDFIEHCYTLGLCTAGEALDAAHEVVEDTKAEIKGIDTKQFMKDRMLETGVSI